MATSSERWQHSTTDAEMGALLVQMLLLRPTYACLEAPSLPFLLHFLKNFSALSLSLSILLLPPPPPITSFKILFSLHSLYGDSLLLALYVLKFQGVSLNDIFDLNMFSYGKQLLLLSLNN